MRANNRRYSMSSVFQYFDDKAYKRDKKKKELKQRKGDLELAEMAKRLEENGVHTS